MYLECSEAKKTVTSLVVGIRLLMPSFFLRVSPRSLQVVDSLNKGTPI